MKILTTLFMLAMLIPPLLVIVSNLIYMKTTKDREKASAFECGFDPSRTARIPFSSRFFMLAVIFLVFDIEIVLLIPMPIMMKTHAPTNLSIAATLFLIILTLGLIHEWIQGSLEWAS